MAYFTSDNTEGFSREQLAAMNEVFYHNLAIAICDLPNGCEGASASEIDEIKQAVGEAILAKLP